MRALRSVRGSRRPQGIAGKTLRVVSLLLLAAALIPFQVAHADAGIPGHDVIQVDPGTLSSQTVDPTPASSVPLSILGSRPQRPSKIFMPVIQTSPPSLSDAESDWVRIGSGIEYRKYVLPDPNLVYVARMERANPSVFLESAIGSGELATGRETVSGMAARYDQALNAWGGSWGGRNRVVVAINGDYFNPGTGYPQNGQIQSGWYVKRYNDYEGWSGFAWTVDRQAFIGACVVNPPDGQFITFPDSGQRQAIDSLNAPRQNGQLTLYTPQYASTTLTDGPGAEVVVQLLHPLTATPPGAAVLGQVVEIRVDKGATPIPFDSVVLSATGQAEKDLLARVHVGDVIGISQQITSVGTDCNSSYPEDWTTVYSGVGGAFTFLRDGQAQHDDATGAVLPNPRTAIAMNGDYIYFIVVDGRNPGVSAGMTFDQLAKFAQDTLGATWGIAQDGGGSSTMVINGQVVNIPSDRCKPGSADQVTTDQDLSNSSGKSAGGIVSCERPVANGMMMVDEAPMDQSHAFSVDAPVVAPNGASLYLGPGTNYGMAGDVPGEAAGKVIDDGHNLNGVQAKNAYWWKVDFGGKQGWVMESMLRMAGGG